VLIGRDEECARIERLLEDARGGRSRTLVIRGEAGIGKSALLEHAGRQAAGMRILRAHGVESETELAFSGLLELCRPVLDRLDALPPRQAAALRTALALTSGEAGDRFTISAGTLSLLANAAEETPLLVAVDDAHWLDSASTEALLFTARRLEADRVAFIFAVREAEGAFPAEGIDELVLEGLHTVAAAALLTSVSPDAVAPAVAERLYTLAHGNPLALVELPRTLSKEQLLGKEPLEEPLQVGKDLERAFARRAASLGERPRRALVVAATNETDQLELTAAALALLDLDLAALEAAEDIKLLRFEDGRVMFRHPLVRSAVYHSAAPSERRAAHAALARALTAAGSDDERRAWHLAIAAVGPDEEVAQALERAAEAARDRSGYSGAAAAYERAARLTERRPERLRRLYHAADAAWLAGRTSQAVALAEEALEDCDDPSLRADLLSLRGHIEHHTGRQMAAYEMLVQAASLFETVDLVKAAATLTDAVECCVYAQEAETALATARRLFELGWARDTAEDFLAHLTLGWALTWVGEPDEGAALLEHARSLVEERDILEGDPRHLVWVAVGPLWVDHPERGHTLATDVVARAREHGAVGVLPYCLHVLAYYSQGRGQWAAACALASEGAALARESAHLADLGHCLFELGWIEAAQGSEQSARAHILEATQTMDAVGMERDWKKLAHRRLGLLELSLGRLDAAIDTLAPLVERLQEREARWLDYEEFPGADLVEAYVRSGRTDEARATLAWFPSLTATHGRPWLRALSARCRGLLAGDDFEKHFSEALACHAEAADVFEEARTRLCLGERLRRAGRRKDARAELRAALAVFEELGATAWVERTRGELRATGERLRRRDPTAAEQLTPQELQIALHVAEGKTNRDVGATLFLSPKTVEFHLGRAYRKLGIHSRAELIRLFASKTGGPEPVAR